jgi:hypothetical protein
LAGESEVLRENMPNITLSTADPIYICRHIPCLGYLVFIFSYILQKQQIRGKYDAYSDLALPKFETRTDNQIQ